MTADQRLDQLEPLISENIAIMDRHTAQLKQLLSIATQHSDSISFILHEVVDIKNRLTNVEADVVRLKADVAEVKAKQDEMSAKLDRILGLLSKS
ncbi:MAG: hypothetical protein ACRYFX_28815 [Janthinobacterium lividum]